MSESKKSLLEQILEKGSEFIKKPFIIKRVKRSFETAQDQLEEKLMDNEAKMNSAREQLVEAARNEGSLTNHLNKILEIRTEKAAIEETQKALKAEKAEFLS